MESSEEVKNTLLKTDSSIRKLRDHRKTKQSIVCPICSRTLRSVEVTPHLQMEMDKLSSLRSRKRSYEPKGVLTAVKQTRFYETFCKIKSRRQRRKNVHTPEAQSCPVCHENIPGSSADLQSHVETCLEPASGDDAEDSFSEYSWAGHTRVRATSLVEGDLAASTNATAKIATSEDDDVIIDGESCEYGEAQYHERDVIPVTADGPVEEKQRQALRGALLNGDSEPSSEAREKRLTSQEENESHTTTSSDCSSIRCLICMGNYRTPLTSVSCWHVYCEDCWLRTLGAKKLCPQCNAITSPADLRKIYL